MRRPRPARTPSSSRPTSPRRRCIPSTPTPPHFRRAALGVHEADGALARRARPAEGLRRGAAGCSSSRRPSRSRRSSCSRRSACPLLQDRLRRGHESAAARGRSRRRASRCSSRPGWPGSRTSSARSAVLRDGGAATLLVLQCTSNVPVPAGAGEPARDGGDGRAVRRSRTGSPTTRRTSTPRSRAVALGAVGDREALHALEAALRPRPSRLARRPRSWRGWSTAFARSRRRSARPRRSAIPRSTRRARPSRRASSARDAIPAGAVIEREMLTTKRPGNGIPALRLGEVVGRRAARAIDANDAARGGRPCLGSKVCVVVASRANYARIKKRARSRRDPRADLQLQLVVGASALLERYGPAIDVIPRRRLRAGRVFAYMVVEGENLVHHRQVDRTRRRGAGISVRAPGSPTSWSALPTGTRPSPPPSRRRT